MANYDGVMISTDELNSVLNSLKKQKELIHDEYQKSIKTVLESSQQCFQVSGVNYSSLISIFDSTFNSLDSNFEALINVLQNNVIKNYSELAVAIKKMFDDNFADKLMSLLGISSSGTGSIQGVPISSFQTSTQSIPTKGRMADQFPVYYNNGK